MRGFAVLAIARSYAPRWPALTVRISYNASYVALPRPVLRPVAAPAHSRPQPRARPVQGNIKTLYNMRPDSRRPAGRSLKITAVLHCIAPFKQLLHAARPLAFVGSCPACGRARFAPQLAIGQLLPAWSMRFRAPRSAVACRLGCVPRRAITGPRFAAALRLAPRRKKSWQLPRKCPASPGSCTRGRYTMGAQLPCVFRVPSSKPRAGARPRRRRRPLTKVFRLFFLL